MRICSGLVTLSFCVANLTHAEEPLAPGRFLGEQGRWRLHASAVYSNSESSTVQSSNYVLVQTDPGKYVQIPASLNEKNSNTDLLMLIPGISYGLSDGTEIGANFATRSVWTRAETASGPMSDSATQFSGASLNLSHTFTKSRKVLIVAGFIDANIAQNVATHDTDFVYGKSLNTGVVIYKLIEPIILSTTAFYQFNRSRSVSGETYTPGNFIVFSPSVYFKANTIVTFSAGLNWTLQQGDKITARSPRSLPHTQTGLDFGLGYAWSEDLSLVVTANTNISGGSGASIVLTASYFLRNYSLLKH